MSLVSKTIRRRYTKRCWRQHDADAMANAKHSSQDFYEAADKGHGRLEHRAVYCLRDVSWLATSGEWKGLKTLVLVESQGARLGVPTSSRRVYISSLDAPAEKFASLIRNHWHVENKLHWVLDVTFGEDRARIKKKNGAQALSALRKLAIGIIKRAPEGKRPTSQIGKMRRVSWSFKVLVEAIRSGIDDPPARDPLIT